MNVLFVEDNETMQGLLGSLFESWGFKFDIASNGREAVELATCNEGKYDVCFMDTSMPIMNGFEATKIMRQKLRYFPIVSTSVDLRYEKELIKLGADDFIAKPSAPDKLQKTLTEWADVKRLSILRQKDTIEIRKEFPMDQQHAKELRELKKQNLIKIKFDDITGAEVVVHKNIINKIVDDFSIKKQFVSTFLNRNPEKPTKCVLFGNNCRMPQVYLSDKDYEEELRIENKEVEKHPIMALKTKEE